MIRVAVKIKLKEEVLDTRGRTLLQRLKKEKSSLKDCRYGKYIEIDVDEKDKNKALKDVEDLAKKFLHNDLIENFELEILNSK